MTDSVHVFSDEAAVIVFAAEDRFVLLVGNTEPQTVAVPVDLERVVDSSKRYTFRMYNSERSAWGLPLDREPGTLGALAFSIEANGFRLVELTPASQPSAKTSEM